MKFAKKAIVLGFIVFLFLSTIILATQMSNFTETDLDELESNESVAFTYETIEALEYSFGLEGFISKSPNETYLRNWFNVTIIWNLEKSVDGITWNNCDELLEIKKDYFLGEFYEKHTLYIYSDEEAYYRVLLSTSINPKESNKIANQDRTDMIFDIGNNEEYGIYYDWSDYTGSPEFDKTYFNKDLDNKLEFNIYTKSKLKQGEVLEIDPYFGYIDESSSITLTSGGHSNIVGQFASPSYDCKAVSITIKTGTVQDTGNWECALYEYTDFGTDFAGALVDYTEKKSITSTDDNTEFTFWFETPPTLSGSSNYYICVKPDFTSYNTNAIKSTAYSAPTNIGIVKTGTDTTDFASFDPLTGEVDLNRRIYAYCSYLPSNSFPSSRTDGRVRYNNNDWDTARNAVSGNVLQTMEEYHGNAVMVTYEKGSYFISRSFLTFDTSSLDDNAVIDNVYLHVMPYSTNNSDVIVVASEWGDTLEHGDYGTVDFDTPYSSNVIGWDNGVYQNISFNSDGLSAINKTGNTTFAIIDYDYDYLSSAPSSAENNGLYFGDHNNNFPYLEVISHTVSVPDITINFAGNLGDDGGPYYRPPGEFLGSEDTVLSGVWENGYYTNDSRQSEDWIYINCTITDATSVYLNWLNGTTWTNDTYSLSNTDGNWWEINTSGTIETYEGYNYSFNINASGTGGDSTHPWNKSVIPFTNENFYEARRTVQLNCTPVNISYATPYYLFDAKYGGRSKYDILEHDQGTDGTWNDTGYLKSIINDDNIQDIACGGFAGAWISTPVCAEPGTIENYYAHVWVSSVSNTTVVNYWNHSKEIPRDNEGLNPWDAAIGDARTGMVVANTPSDTFLVSHNEWYRLHTNFVDVTDWSFTDNNIYQFMYQVDTSYVSLISNRSISSFIILNVPDNETLNASHSDTDSDGLSDWTELYINYTNPFVADTDGDGVSDYGESMSGSNPNIYTDTIQYYEPSDTPINFVNESPGNNSAEQELSLTWTCDVWDSEGDFTDWHVQCLGFSDSGSANDTASLSISGLTYSTEYTVQCFGNDSNNYTYEEFKFTTMSNLLPELSNASPTNGVHVLTNPKIYVDIEDDDLDNMNLQLWSNSSGTWSIFANEFLDVDSPFNGFEPEESYSDCNSTHANSTGFVTHNGSYGTLFDDTDYFHRTLDLIHVNKIRFNFWCRGYSNDPDDYLYIRFFDGTDWHTIDTITSDIATNTYQEFYYWINATDYTFGLDCKLGVNVSCGTGDYYCVDDINFFLINRTFNHHTTIVTTNSNFTVFGEKYYWSANLSDGTGWTNETYHFYTYFYPEVNNPSPSNESIGVSLNTDLSFNIADNDGDTMNVTIYAKLMKKFDDSVYSRIVTSTYSTDTPVRMPHQRTVFFAQGYYWCFYNNQVGAEYRLKYITCNDDGDTWNSPYNAELLDDKGSDQHAEFDCFVTDDKYVYVVVAYYSNSVNYKCIYRKGVLLDNGTISWNYSWQEFANPSVYNIWDSHMTVDSNGDVWMGFNNISGGYLHPVITKSEDNTDGGWTNASGFPFNLDSGEKNDYWCMPEALDDGKVYVFMPYGHPDGIGHIYGRLWNGESWEAEENLTTRAINNSFWGHSATVGVGNEAHIVFTENMTTLVHGVKNVYTGEYAEYIVTEVFFGDATGLDGTAPTLAKTSDGGLICMWAKDDTMYYAHWNNTHKTWVTKEYFSETGMSEAVISIAYKEVNNTIPFVFYEPYGTDTIRFGRLNVSMEQSLDYGAIGYNTSVSNSSVEFGGDSSFYDYGYTYYWYVNVSDGLLTTQSDIYHFTTNLDNRTQLSFPIITPDSGIDSYTTFYFNITWTDPTYTPANGYLYVNISRVGWYTNQSMSWVSGDNTTGAAYTYNTTLTTGNYQYVFYSYNSIAYNQSGPHSGPTVDPQSMSFTVSTASETGDFEFFNWTNATGFGLTNRENVSEDNQTDSISAFSIINTGNLPLNISVMWLSDPGSGIDMKYSLNNVAPNPGMNDISITPTETQIISNLSPTGSQNVWLWMDFIYVQSQESNADVRFTSALYDV